jgi:hypothetical protein
MDVSAHLEPLGWLMVVTGDHRIVHPLYHDRVIHLGKRTMVRGARTIRSEPYASFSYQLQQRDRSTRRAEHWLALHPHERREAVLFHGYRVKFFERERQAQEFVFTVMDEPCLSVEDA